MKKSALISDLLFLFLLSFVFITCLFRYLSLSVFLSVGFAVILAGGLSVLAFFPLNKKYQSGLNEEKETRQKENFFLYFSLLDKTEQTELIKKAVLLLDETATPTVFRELTVFDGDEKRYVFLISLSPVSLDTLVPVFRESLQKDTELYLSRSNECLQPLLKKFGITLHTEDELFKLLKQAEVVPDAYPFDTPSRKTARKRRIWFSKSNASGFMLSGIFLLISSLLTPFPFYYLLFGGISLFLAVFTRFFGYGK